jgi:hypothetical protein
VVEQLGAKLHERLHLALVNARLEAHQFRMLRLQDIDVRRQFGILHLALVNARLEAHQFRMLRLQDIDVRRQFGMLSPETREPERILGRVVVVQRLVNAGEGAHVYRAGRV